MTHADTDTDVLTMCVERLATTHGVDLAHITTAASADGGDPMPYYELARLCRRLGHIDLWQRCVECAFPLQHLSHQQLYQRGNARLLLDEWSGWADREARIYDPSANYLASNALRSIRFNIREWDGKEDLCDKTLLVLADGSVGECLLMLRYIPLLIPRSGRLAASMPPEMVGLVRQLYGRSVMVTLGLPAESVKVDRYVWMTSLPAVVGEPPPFEPLFGTTPAPRSETGDRPLQFGMCWATDSKSPQATEWSVPADLLVPFVDREDVRWCSLQSSEANPQHPLMERMHHALTPVYTCTQMIQAVAPLDAVVTVDATIAHLAGVLGVPTWLMLHADAEPHWGMGRRTRWYPRMIVIRQRLIGDWTDALVELSACIDALDWPVAPF